MANINRVIITGNLTSDPELLQPAERHVGLQAAASPCNRRHKDSASGEWVDKPNYFDVTVWGAQGENCANYLSKGRRVAVDGRLEWREWESQDGSKRQAVEIVADTVQFLGSRGDGEGGGAGGAARGGFQQTAELRPDPVPAGGGSERRRHPVLEGGRRGSQAEASHEAPSRRQAGSTRRKTCYFCKDKVEEIDYKNYNQLRRYVSEKGKIRSRRITGACRRHQRQVAVAVKRAREVALLPYAVN